MCHRNMMLLFQLLLVHLQIIVVLCTNGRSLHRNSFRVLLVLNILISVILFVL